MATDLGPAAPAIISESVTRRRWQPTPATFIWLFALVWGLFIGLKPLDDNSLFTHVATGRIIFQSGFPHADPYLFTPHEPSWVVQSWLASVVYWTIVRTWAFAGLLTLTAALTAVLALLVVRLSRPADGFIARALLVLVTLAIGAGAWAERPFMFGLVFLSITLIAADDGLDPRWLVPVMYLWVNMHGSFPLGLLALVLLWVGRRLDHEPGTTEWRCLEWAALGTALSVLNPSGTKPLVFPLFLLHRSDMLRHIIEWQAPSYRSLWEKFFLVQIALAVLVLAKRPSWRLALPFATFVPAALYSSRNLLVASLVLTATMAPALKGLGDLKADARLSSRPLAWAGAFMLAAVAVLTVVSATHKPAVELGSYPVQALAFAEANHLVPPPDGSEGRLLTQDFVGNLREYLDGPIGDVFVDDRAEVLDKQVQADYIALLGLSPAWQAALDRYDIDAIVWQRDLPLATVLKESPDWQIRYTDPHWIVATRRTAPHTA
jgi:hypothetical protein